MKTYFDMVGLDRRYHLSLRELEERYHAGAREHHPDRHVRDAERQRVASALATAELTEAYRTLKDPVKRAEYLLELEGVRIADERSAHPVAPGFLVEIMELREGLEEARGAKDEARVQALGADVRGRSERAMAEVGALFQRYDGGDRAALPAIADALVALRYYRRFLDELEAHEEEQE